MQRPTCDGLRERDYASGDGGSADVGLRKWDWGSGTGGSGNGANGMRTDRKCTGCTSSGRQASAVRFAETWRRAPSTVNRYSPHGASECAGRQAGNMQRTTRHPQDAASSIYHATCNVKHTIQHADCSIQHTPCNQHAPSMQGHAHARCSKQRATCSNTMQQARGQPRRQNRTLSTETPPCST